MVQKYFQNKTFDELHPDSRALTTFPTHTGLKRYKRLLFGLSSASEKYQYVILDTLQGITGARKISDDIIFGKDQESHDRSLEETFKRLNESGLTLSKDKCLFSVSELIFFGFKVSAASLSPDDKKVEAIQSAPTPRNAEVRSFLGLVNYCARFIPDFSTLSEPLRQLTRKEVQWPWTTKHQEAFEKLKSSWHTTMRTKIHSYALMQVLLVSGQYSCSTMGPPFAQ